MPNVARRFSALCLAGAMASSGLISASPATTDAASTGAWTLPTVPAKCTTAQIDSGNVAGCAITLGPGLPETRGWPTPPFFDPGTGGVLAWVDLARGSSGPVVARVQTALNTNGATLTADGQFGSLTETAVKAFQSASGISTTGVVDQATATLLGVQNTSTGVFPPFGWTWLGWGYNRSEALYQWELQIVGNTAAIGKIRPGQLRSFPDALPLFEGFLRDIQANGYVIGDAGMYVFRCTASTRKDCAGLSRSSLSNHAYGLALDINTAANPLKSYSGVGGASACQTPIDTDIPQWVVQTGEKWGLYWGGYGWSSGCSSPSQVKSSASRDPMHFEFNGTVAQARAILAFNGGPSSSSDAVNSNSSFNSDPSSCFEVATNDGVIGQRCFGAAEVPGSGTRMVISTGAPAGATAALVNITTTSADSGGFITAEECGAAPATRQWSNGNTRSGRAVASAAIVTLDAHGQFCLYQSAPMQTIVDVQGYFATGASAPAGNLFTPVANRRITDTRNAPFCTPGDFCRTSGPLPANTEIIHVSEAPLNVAATVANITVTSPNGNGYVTADACASLSPGPQTRSNVNFGNGDTVANFAVVPSTANVKGAQFCSYSPNGLQQLVDVFGFFAPAWQGGLGYSPLAPTRVVDTRQCWTDPIGAVQRCNKLTVAGGLVRMRAPVGATAVVVNLTSVDATQGYVTVDSCSRFTAAPPTISSLNAAPGAAVANLAIVPVAADGTYCAYTSSPMNLIVDLLGTFSASGPLRYTPVTPVRVHDTRQRG